MYDLFSETAIPDPIPTIYIERRERRIDVHLICLYKIQTNIYTDRDLCYFSATFVPMVTSNVLEIKIRYWVNIAVVTYLLSHSRRNCPFGRQVNNG